MVREIGKLIHRLTFVGSLSGDYDLRGLLADLFEDLVDSLFKEIRCVRALGLLLLSLLEQAVQSLEAELRALIALLNGSGEARVASGMARRSILFDHNDKRVAVAVRRDRDYVLIVAARLSLEPQLLP